MYTLPTGERFDCLAACDGFGGGGLSNHRFVAEGRKIWFDFTDSSSGCEYSLQYYIAEGHGRSGRDDFLRFLDIALGSSNEVETQLLITIRLKMLTEQMTEKAMGLIQEVQKITKGLIRSISNTNNKGPRAAKPR